MTKATETLLHHIAAGGGRAGGYVVKTVDGAQLTKGETRRCFHRRAVYRDRRPQSLFPSYRDHENCGSLSEGLAPGGDETPVDRVTVGEVKG